MEPYRLSFDAQYGHRKYGTQVECDTLERCPFALIAKFKHYSKQESHVQSMQTKKGAHKWALFQRNALKHFIFFAQTMPTEASAALSTHVRNKGFITCIPPLNSTHMQPALKMREVKKTLNNFMAIS